jgi:hypothetical protein
MGAIPITVRLLCIKLASSNPSCVGPPLPLQPYAFSHRHLQRQHHTPSLISLSIVIISSSTPVPTEPRLPHLNNSSYSLTSTTAPTEPQPPHHQHHHAQTLHQANHLQSLSRWSDVASPTMRLLTPAPTTAAPHAFHHQLEHCHCLFINSGSTELRLPHLNNSSYRATSPHRSAIHSLTLLAST